MANMGYCRFQNTVPDLRDCEEALDDFDSLSDDEQQAAKRLLKICHRIAENYEADAFA